MKWIPLLSFGLCALQLVWVAGVIDRLFGWLHNCVGSTDLKCVEV